MSRPRLVPRPDLILECCYSPSAPKLSLLDWALGTLIRSVCLGACCAAIGGVDAADAASTSISQKPRKIVLLAGKLDGGHPRGTHEYELTARLLKHCLDGDPRNQGIATEVHFDGWPNDPTTLDDADTIVVISNGADRDPRDHPLLVGERMKVLARQMDRGCGLVLIHWATFMPKEYETQTLDWVGGYFDYESGPGANHWYSKIQTSDGHCQPATPDHPISRGLAPFDLHEEFYYRIRFREGDPRLRPILTTPIPGENESQVVAWAVERDGGGRGFGFTGGHFFENWSTPDFRRMALNAILWTAHAEVPEDGASWPGDRSKEEPIKALIVTGHQYPGHLWRETTPVIEESLRRDPRFEVTVVVDPEIFAKDELARYDVVVMNYCNWESPGLSEDSKRNFQEYLANGGGLAIVHFANGAFHFSLPKAAESDWPEWRTKICRRVWDHSPGKSGHDAYGPFRVSIVKPEHSITQGMPDFDTTDELYCNQQGDEPIEVLATAHSKITNRDEPMAMVHSYEKGRVFQTVLGHDVAALRTPEVGELIRRGATWAAERETWPKDLEPRAPRANAPMAPATPKPAAPKPTTTPATNPTTFGKIGQAFDATKGHATAEYRPDYASLPISVQAWTKLASKTGFNVIVSNQPKESSEHWEIYSYAGSGQFSLYLPGYEPSEILSPVDIVDDRWRQVAMSFDGQRARLYVDGELAQETPVRKVGNHVVEGPLWIGGYPPQAIGMDGLVDEVLVRRGDHEPLAEPSEADFEAEESLGAWSFDTLDEGRFRDRSRQGGDASWTVAAMPSPNVRDPGALKDHFFDWTEDQARDDRWGKTKLGPFFSGSVRTGDQTTTKAICVRVGDSGQGAICFDTELLRYSSGWSGDFIRFDPARFGLIQIPSAGGEEYFGTRAIPGWSADKSFVDPRPRAPWGNLPRERGHYRGLRVQGQRVVLEYSVDGTTIRDSPWFEGSGSLASFTRTVQVGPRDKPLSFVVCSMIEPAPETAKDADRPTANDILIAQSAGFASAWLETEPGTIAVATTSRSSEIELWATPQGEIAATIAPSDRTREFKFLIWSGDYDDLRPFVGFARKSPPAEDLNALSTPGAGRWPERIVTQGRLGDGENGYVVDTLTLPFDNPYLALFFTSGLDFFSNGDAAVCTVHGDVWRVRGVDESLAELRWNRFATGLFQPLGLKIVADRVYVLGRDQITRLEDENEDGEADHYVNFNNDGEASLNTHEFATCLETDSRGAFYYLRGDSGGITAHDGCLLEVSPDGERLEVFATGFRNANGLAIGPDDFVTVSPQEGNWTPGSAIFAVERGGFYGNMPTHHRPEPPADFSPPLCWIPRFLDNSSGGQVWATDRRFGPLAGALLHMSFGRCGLYLVTRDTEAAPYQGGVVPLPLDFESGITRGRVNPRDGQVYLVGLQGWVSSAVRDGCFQRVRYVGGGVDLPVAAKWYRKGVAITFSRPLDRAEAEDPDSYRAVAWDYRWSANYGSAEYRPSDPKTEGHDEWPTRRATLLDDSRTVFLELDGQRPAMQVSLEITSKGADGAPIETSWHGTIHQLAPDDPTLVEALAAHDRKRSPAANPGEGVARISAQDLSPGLIARFSQGSDRSSKGKPGTKTTTHDARVARLAALDAQPGESPTPFLKDGPFQVVFEGYVSTPRKGEYGFSAEGSGEIEIALGGKTLWQATGDDFGRTPPVVTRLRRGLQPIRVTYRADGRTQRQMRLKWSSTSFADEPIPPTALFHDPSDAELLAASRLRLGMNLFRERNCGECHQGIEKDFQKDSAAPKKVEPPGPSLVGVGGRLSPDWLADWLNNVRGARAERTMPHLFSQGSARDRQAVADLVAYLTSLASEPPAGEATSTSNPDTGEALFEDLGCIACHYFPKSNEADAYARVSLSAADSKYRPGALLGYLLAPHAHHRRNPMPDFGLTEEQAQALAGYLRERSRETRANEQNPRENQVAGDAGRGRVEFAVRGCARCHDDGSKSPAGNYRLPTSFTLGPSGCLAPDRASDSRAPDFGFSPPEREALLEFLRTAQTIAPVVSAADDLAWKMVHFRCTACHERDGRASPRAQILADEGSRGLTPDSIPSLTFAGEKLREDWTIRLLSGKLTYRARPWLSARMPHFPGAAEELARGLATEHGFGATVPTESTETSTPEQAEPGLRLIAKEGGLDCRQCHGLETITKRQPNDAQGISFRHVGDRLRRDYYDRWMVDPLRIDPRSKMPKFSKDGKRTAAREILEGDARRQFDAIWTYLRSVEVEAPH